MATNDQAEAPIFLLKYLIVPRNAADCLCLLYLGPEVLSLEAHVQYQGGRVEAKLGLGQTASLPGRP